MNLQSRFKNSQVCWVISVPPDYAAGLLRNFIAALDAESAQREPFMKYARRAAELQLTYWEAEAPANQTSNKLHPEPIGSHRAGSAQKAHTSPLSSHIGFVPKNTAQPQPSPSTGKSNKAPHALEFPHKQTATSGAVAVPIFVAYERHESTLTYAWRLMKERNLAQPHPVIGVMLLCAMLLLLAIFCIAIDPASGQY